MTKAQKALIAFNSKTTDMQDRANIREILAMHDKLVEAVNELMNPYNTAPSNNVLEMAAYCQKEIEQP